MKKTLLFVMLFVAFAMNAQSPDQVLDNAIKAINNAGVVTANYAVSSSQGNMTGSIVIKGNKFRLISNDLKCWYNGKTQWTYSSATDEVNITTPTASELAMTNPLAAAQSFKKNFTATKAPSQVAGSYAVLLKPKGKNDITQAVFYVTNGINLLNKAQLKMKNGSTVTVTLSGYKTKVNMPESTFTYNAKMVPAGTAVIDLR